MMRVPPPEVPTPRGLFRPSLFKSLFKARTTANTGSKGTPVEPSLGLDSTECLFSEPVLEQEVIPSPKLFLDVIQRLWSQPAEVTPPSNNDKRLFGPGPDLEGLLQMPTMDPPVAALTSPPIVPSDASEG